VLLRSSSFDAAPHFNWSSEYLARRFGAEEVSINLQDEDEANARSVLLREFVASLVAADRRPRRRTDGYRTLLLSERGGSDFVLSRPALVDALQPFATLLPRGYRRSLRMPIEDSYQFSLWLAPRGALTGQHADLSTGTLLSHIEGRKRVWLYPPSQQPLLYADDWVEENGEWVSPIDPRRPWLTQLWRYPRFALSRATVLELRPGDTIFVPCGWFHFVE